MAVTMQYTRHGSEYWRTIRTIQSIVFQANFSPEKYSDAKGLATSLDKLSEIFMNHPDEALKNQEVFNLIRRQLKKRGA